MNQLSHAFQLPFWLNLIGCVLLGSCAGFHPNQNQGKPSKLQSASFIQKHHLTPATPEEVSLAKSTVALGNSIRKSKLGYRITYRPGKLVGAGNSNLSTTSTYELSDATERMLGSIPTRHDGTETGFVMHVSPDGKTVHVSDRWGDGCSIYDLHGIFRIDDDSAETPARWSVRCVCLPSASEDEFELPEVIGIIGNQIFFDPHLDGKIYKADIDALDASYPFPFGIG